MFVQDTLNRSNERFPYVVHLLAGRSHSVAQPTVSIPVTAVEKSAYLRTRIRRSPALTGPMVIELPEASPTAVRLYAWWLQFDNMPLCLHDRSGLVAQPQQTLIWRECFDLIQAHLLGWKFGDAGFQRYILDQLDAWLTPHPELDLELLDYLWGLDEGSDDELICFVMSRMFQIYPNKVEMLVEWIKGCFTGGQMIKYLETPQGYSRRGEQASTTGSFKNHRASPDQANRGEREIDSPNRAGHRASPELESRDSTPQRFYQENKVDLHRYNAARIQGSPGHNTNTVQTRSQSTKANSVARLLSSVVPTRKPTFHTSTAQIQSEMPLNTPGVPSNVLRSVASTRSQQRSASIRPSPLPDLHPLAREASSRSHLPVKSQETKGAPHGGTVNAFSRSPLTSMPALLDLPLQRLNPGTASSPSELPDTCSWAQSTVSTAYAGLNKDRGSVPLLTSPPSLPSLSPTTKQIIQSFTMTRTPTPRRRATRSWSVASIQSLEKATSGSENRAIDEPRRGIISRKPVPEGGLQFLSRYLDGERLRKVVGINSRPERRALRTDYSPEEAWEVQRPGTA